MYDSKHYKYLDLILTARISASVSAEDELEGYDINQDLISLLAGDLGRLINNGEIVRRLNCDSGDQDVRIEFFTNYEDVEGLSVSDVTGE